MTPQRPSGGGAGQSGGARRGGGAGQSGGARRGGPTRRATSARGRSGGDLARPIRPKAAGPAVDVHTDGGVRLQKLLAAAGVGSRRACEALMAAGRVEVDGQVVTELGTRIDPVRQVVHVDGVRVQLDASRVYLAFNKPKGVVSTMQDDRGRPALADYLTTVPERLFHVGRLDADTEGLLLLTNDGELAHRLQHPSYGVAKTYLAQVPGPIAKGIGKQLREGVELEDGPVQVDSFKVVDSAPGKALVEVVLHEGRKHVVRRMLESVGHPVQALVRTDVGPIQLGELRSGRYRALSRAEVGALYAAVGL